MKWLLFRMLPKLPIFLLALPFVLLMRALRPFIKIRFVPILERIGHGFGTTDIYLQERRAGFCPSDAVDIFYPDRPWKCNRQMVKMWKRVVPLYDFAYWVAWASLNVPGFEPYHYDLPPDIQDTHGLTNDTPPPASFSLKEEERGAKLLREMGIPPGSPIICFQARDSSFLNALKPEKNWSYHNYRDADINTYTLAIKELVARGYYCIRMGRVVNQPFLWKHPHVIDYATSSWRSDFADMYLLSRCHFYVGTSSGIDFIATFFRKPQVILNMIPVVNTCAWSPDNSVIYKKIWVPREKRSLTFKEILGFNVDMYQDPVQFKNLGLEIIDNTPQEILDVVIEKEESIRGCWQTNDECEELQQRFWALFRPYASGRVLQARVGSKFLLQNKDLLDLKMAKQGVG